MAKQQKKKPEIAYIGVKGHVFAKADLAGVTAETIRKRLKKEGVEVTAAYAKTLHKIIND